MIALLGLFFAAFLAATLIPAQSEAVLVGLLLSEGYSALLLVMTATLGNVLGSVVNWVLGRFLTAYADRRWFPVSEQQLSRAAGWYRRWGYWSLLGSWLPIVGDPLTLAAGVMKEPLWRFILIVTLSKGGRYVVLAMATEGFL
jgi:membrane protein YqaA with SNARE-associated domain